MKVQVTFTVDVNVGKKGREVSKAEIEQAVASGIAYALPPIIHAEEWLNTEDGSEPSIKVLTDSPVVAKIL